MNNITEIQSFKVSVYKTKANQAMKKDFIGYAKVVGAYFRPYWHPYSYSAYHVIFDDGRKDTVYADHCQEESK